MVGFKKDKNKPQHKLRREVLKYLSTFLAGFIIALFLVLYIVMAVVNHLNSEDATNNNEPTSSEVTPSGSDSTPEVDKYKDEKAIYSNLLKLSKERVSEIEDIISVNYDTDYIYVTGKSSDNYLYILRGEISEEVDVILETLITDTDNFEITGDFSYSLEVSSIDISSLDIFKNDEAYKGYSYRHKINYYTNSLHNRTAMNTIGYNDNSYIAISNIIYDESTTSIDLGESYINKVSNKDSIYYSLLDYLYNK